MLVDAAPVIAGSLIIIIVFLPLLALQGLEGKLFTPVALTIVFALAGSLVLSLTVIPVFASYLLKHDALEEPWLARQLRRLYIPILKWSIVHSKKVFVTAAAMLLLTIVIFMQIGATNLRRDIAVWSTIALAITNTAIAEAIVLQPFILYSICPALSW